MDSFPPLPYNPLMPRKFLCDCQPGETIEDVFVVTNKQIAQGVNGKHYIKAFLSDRSMQITARVWNATQDMFKSMPESGFIRVRARVESYQNNLQVIIEQMWPAKDGTYQIGDLLPHTANAIEPMVTRLREILDSIQNRHVAALVQAYLDDANLMRDFHRAPAAQTFHHAFIGGLLEHTLNAVEVADAAIRFYPDLNRDLVLAGLFLHDIAKTWELKYETAFGYSDGGQLVGHVVKSAMWVEEKAKAAELVLGEKIPRALIDVMQHIILSHHEKPDFGAARKPATPEALFVALIDNLDAKMMILLQACRGERAEGQGNWTEYLKAFEGRFFRPDLAPAEIIDNEPVEAGGAAPAGEAHETPTLKLVLNNPLFESSPKKK